MIEEIKLLREDHLYFGRNGTGKMRGIEIMTGQDRITLTPVNSKGVARSCEMQIGYDDIDALISLLIKAKSKQDKPYSE